jgi:anti-anti-sigma regulatory factor
MSTAMSPVTIFVNEGAGVSVTGTLDASTVAHLNRTVSEFFELEHADGIDVLTLDLSTVTMCDEAALAAVRHARALCTDHAVALRVIPSDAVRYAMRPRV